MKTTLKDVYLSPPWQMRQAHDRTWSLNKTDSQMVPFSGSPIRSLDEVSPTKRSR